MTGSVAFVCAPCSVYFILNPIKIINWKYLCEIYDNTIFYKTNNVVYITLGDSIEAGTASTTGEYMEHVSQKNNSHADYGCGVASLMMLLKHAQLKQVPPYDKLAKELRITECVTKKWGDQYEDHGKGAYPGDITRYLKNVGIPFLQIHDPYNVGENLKNRKSGSFKLLIHIAEFAPVMIGELYENAGHWVVLCKDGKKFMRYDPEFLSTDPQAIAEVDTNIILEKWDGCAIQILTSAN